MILSFIYPTIFLPIITISMVVAQTQIEYLWEKQLKDWRHHLFIVFCFTAFYIVQTLCIANVTIFTFKAIAYMYVIPTIMVLRNRQHIWWFLLFITPLIPLLIDLDLKRYAFINVPASLLQVSVIALACFILNRCQNLSYQVKYVIALYCGNFIHYARLSIENQLHLNFVIALLIGTTVTIICEGWRYYFQNKHNESIAKLHYESKRDALTGLLNFRAFDQEMKKLSKRSTITNTYVGVIDIDHFKEVNDTYGHLNGNIVLHTFSQKLKHEIDQAFLPNCFVYRFGGDEFAIVIFNANPEQILAILNNVERYFRNNLIKIPHSKTRIKLSFSCGLTKHLSNEAFYHTLERADNLVYKVKNSGRGKILTDYTTKEMNNA